MPIVRVALHLPGITTGWRVVPFLLDTGADGTTLHPTDTTTALGIDPATLSDVANWPRSAVYEGIGGSGIYSPHSAAYAFQHEDGL